MKKQLLLLVGITILSCDSPDSFQKQNVENNNSFVRRERRSSMFSYIESIKIDKGSDCGSDILIFPSWEKLWETADKLDEMIDKECDLFDATIPDNITDEKYDDLADIAGFDEDNVLVRFEDDLAFCSLRKKVEVLENKWIESQGDGDWNINEDPDNHFIYDETERALFSVNNEVIIGEKKTGYIYYKLIDNFNWIEVHDWDINAIKQVSRGLIPTNNPNVIVVKKIKTNENLQSSAECKTHIKKTRYYLNGTNRIKIKSKVINNDSWGAKKISALTVGYKKKNGKWKRARTRIAAGVTGSDIANNSVLYQNCGIAFEKHKVKEKRRRRVKAKIRGQRFDGASLIIGIKPQKAYSYHKQGSINLRLDYYDMY
ncbi:hypothetical protein [Flavobacterium sp. Leaf359]|jgi:hypothetical protein|uniref:hypothetical protein n=1 Tax=Flavobacterium sp. Leaf359 TaxID=1736351 RepID=UPI000B1745D0|nr:hypothetical protein [Flavobacterium sp. Leaf359]